MIKYFNIHLEKNEIILRIHYVIMFIWSVLLASCVIINAQNIPKSPYNTVCPTRNGPYNVNNFKGTPYMIKPFQDTFINPDIKEHTHKVCRSDAHCLFTYEINIVDVQLRPFDKIISECSKLPATWFLSYDGKVPGPSIITPTGHETLIRFNNKLTNRYFKERYDPCIMGRNGRPISVHFHGSASLAPFDGWAEDETCASETKDYVYPNNRPVTGWYHDHALHITADNAYFGLAGGYIISSKKQYGGCGEPWNLENIEERLMILNDRVLDNKCQLFIDVFDNHKNNLYGDINVVSGIPFPNMFLEPKWYRFRVLNAAVSRPYLVKLKLESTNGVIDVGHNLCHVIAGDGGYRNSPVAFPEKGLLIGVAERYEVVCDFSSQAGKILYFWNDRHPTAMKDVPYFCYSHLLAKVSVSQQTVSVTPFDQKIDNHIQPNILAKVLSNEDVNMAIQWANEGKFNRRMVFGRSNGHWTINGESWDSFKIAVDDIGQNTWELWMFQTGGGWFHPVHMHLVDFYIIKREGESDGVRSYEIETPKDVLYLGPGNKLWVIARFGAHKGDYMFHCHNLIHEDNDMMRAMRIMDKGMNSNQQSAQQYILNPLHKIIYNNWKYSDPMLGETAAKQSNSVLPVTSTLAKNTLDKNLYRIFYPSKEDEQLQEGYTNPWKSQWCPV